MTSSLAALDDDDVCPELLGFRSMLDRTASGDADDAAIFQLLNQLGVRRPVVTGRSNVLADDRVGDDVGTA